MKKTLALVPFRFAGRLALAVSLLLPAAVVAACGDDNVDSNNGKAISDLDIGGDITVDKGQTKQLSATVKYADGTSNVVTTSSDLVWNIGNTDVATVADGVVTGVEIGTTNVKATYQGKESASHLIIVK
ncbi:MAG: Ig-like domain-containing protein [Labilithrix sp.]|nr:Ig-like domain-containing protein [Labilithrix sp.]